MNTITYSELIEKSIIAKFLSPEYLKNPLSFNDLYIKNLTCKELSEQYFSNQYTSDDKYKGKLFYLKCQVGRIYKIVNNFDEKSSIQNFPAIIVNDFPIILFFLPDDIKNIKNFNSGNSIFVLCRIIGLNEQCTTISASAVILPNKIFSDK